MKAVLITLSGDPDIASRLLHSRYKDLDLQHLPRSLIENTSMRERLSTLRRLRADIFCVMTEALKWQYGQSALMLFGALGGARQSLVVDSRGSERSATRGELLLLGPVRLAGDALRGTSAVRRARRKLRWLEGQIEKRNSTSDRASKTNLQSPAMAYLRTSPAAGTLPGGAASHVNGVANALTDLGVDLTFISNDEFGGLNKSKLTFYETGTETDVIPRAAFDVHNGMLFSDAASSILAAKPCDLVYERYSRFSYAGVEASISANIPLFLEYNGSEVWIGKHWGRTQNLDLLERYERLNLAAATRIFVVSDVERNNLLTAGVSADKIVVNPNGVDIEKFRPGVGGDAERQRLGIPDNAIVVGFVGSFGPWHGVLELADAIARMPDDTRFRFLLVGDGIFREEVETRLKKAGVLDRVMFTGVVSHERVPALLDACDILVSPHVQLTGGGAFFGSPTKLFEYMAMGKGIVASRLGQIGEVLVDGETALLTEPGNSAELAAAILRMGNSRDLREELGSAARKASIEKHTWKQNAERVLETFATLQSQQ